MNHPIDKELEQLERELGEPIKQTVQLNPTPEETAVLIAALQQEFEPLKAKRTFPPIRKNELVHPPTLRRLLLGQFRHNHKALIASAAVVFILLFLVINPMEPVQIELFSFTTNTLFPLVTPMLLVVSLFYGCRTSDPGMRAIESITPYPPALVMYSRMIIVTASIIGWGIISSLLLQFRVAMADEVVTFHLGVFLLRWLGITLLIGGVVMDVLFRIGIKSAVTSSLLILSIWLLFQTPLKEFVSSGLLALSIHTGMLVVGALLMLDAYFRSVRIEAVGDRGL